MRSVLIFLFTCLFPTLATAHQDIEILEAYVVDTTPGMDNGAGYIVLKNAGPSEARLIGVSSSIAEATQVHTHVEDGDLRRMVEFEMPLILAPGEVLTMRPGGIHVMFLGLYHPLRAGDQIDVKLHFQGRYVRDLDLSLEVLSLNEVEKMQRHPTNPMSPENRDHSLH